MSTRTNTQKLTLPCYRWYQSACPTVRSERSPLLSTVILTDTITYGPNVANYKQKIARGMDATSTATGTTRTLDLYKAGEFHVTPKCPGWTAAEAGYTGYLEPVTMPTSTSDVDLQVVDAIAKRFFLKKAIAAHRSFQGGVALGELRETLRMIRNPAQKLRSSIRDYFRVVKKRRKSTLPKHRKRLVQDSYLEYAFGWAPLFKDIAGACDALNAIYDIDLKYIKGDSKPQKDIVLGNLSLDTSHSVCHYYYRMATERSAHVIYRGAVRSSAFNPVRTVQSNWGFDPRDFVPTAWELVPYSFLVDYFANIGDVLEGWSWQNLDLSWTNTTRIQKKSQILLEMYPDAAYLATIQNKHEGFTFSPQRTVMTRKDWVRSTYAGSFVPNLTFQIPGIGSLKWANIGALIRFESRGLRPFF